MHTIYVSNCGHDENGHYTGGVAGDQTGTEWHIIPWYQFGQNVVLRHKNLNVANKLSDLAREAATNNMIGYDQGQRTTFYEQLKRSKWHPRLIKNYCEADCSSGVCALVLAVGHLLNDARILDNVSKDGYTGNMRDMLSSAGFEVLTNKKYLYSADYLLAGDIILNERMHTNIVVNSSTVKTVFVLEEDGLLGYKSILMLQQELKTIYKDGLISGQFIDNRKYLPSLISVDYNDTGSQTIYALQKLLGVECDGYAGYDTICALQKRLNNKLDITLTIDGILGYHTAVNLQKALNEHVLI